MAVTANIVLAYSNDSELIDTKRKVTVTLLLCISYMHVKKNK